MHVPKTGGALLTGVLANRFAASEVRELYFGPQRDFSDLDRYRYVSGHFDFAFIERWFERRPFVFTVLRDPIDRALSAYFFSRSFGPDYELPQTVRLDWTRGDEKGKNAREWWRLVPQYSLRELISNAPQVARQLIGNRQSRDLSPCIPGEEDLTAATAALERCDFVGLTERLDESIHWLTRRLGWRDLGPLPRSNESDARRRREQIDADTMEALARLTEVDRKLYAHAVKRYERQLEEWEALRDPRDAAADIPDAVPVSDLSFDQAILGGGWMSREPTGDGGTFCWMGSTRRAWVAMVPEPRAGRLDVEIPHVLGQDVLEGLRVAIDDRVIPHVLSEVDGRVVATIPMRRQWLRRRPVTVSLEVDRSGPPQEVDPDSLDRRELAIAVRRVTIGPA
jgi:hypothetical protein